MTESDEELLARVLAGDLDPGSQVWKAAAARNPALAARWDELRALRDALERTGLDEREALAQARAAASEDDALRVRRSLARPKRRWWSSGRLISLAAAVVVVCLGYMALERLPRPTPEQPLFLGDEGYVGLEPTLELGDARLFRWEGERPPAGDFVVRVFEIDATGGAGRMVLESEPCTERTWRPSESQLARIPSEFLWEVEARRAGGQHHALSAVQRAQRSRP